MLRQTVKKLPKLWATALYLRCNRLLPNLGSLEKTKQKKFHNPICIRYYTVDIFKTLDSLQLLVGLCPENPKGLVLQVFYGLSCQYLDRETDGLGQLTADLCCCIRLS